jgi:hypothetical protein
MGTALNGSCAIGIRAQTPRRFRECTANSNHGLPIARNRPDLAAILLSNGPIKSGSPISPMC